MQRVGMFQYALYHMPSAGLIAVIVGILCAAATLHYRQERSRMGVATAGAVSVLLFVLGFWVWSLQTHWNHRMDYGPSGLPVPVPSRVLFFFTLVAVAITVGCFVALARFAPETHIRLFGVAFFVGMACLMNELWIDGSAIWIVFQLFFELAAVAVMAKRAYSSLPRSGVRRAWREIDDIIVDNVIPVDFKIDNEPEDTGPQPTVQDSEAPVADAEEDTLIDLRLDDEGRGDDEPTVIIGTVVS